MYIRSLILFLGFLLCYMPIRAQKSKKSYLVPSASAFSLGKNEIEVNAFGAFSYNFRAFNFIDAPYEYLDGRYHSLNNNLQLTYGISGSGNFNVGVDVNQQTSIDPNAGINTTFFRIGPRLRWRPLGALSATFDLALQHSIQFKMNDENEIFTNDPLIRNQLIVSKFMRLDAARIDLVLQGVAEFVVAPRVAWGDMDKKRPLVLPISLLAGLMPNENWVFFTSVNYGPEWGTLPWVSDDSYYLRRSGTSVSTGLQNVIARKHSLFLAHTFLLDEKRGGGANTISLGLRLLFIEQYD